MTESDASNAHKTDTGEELATESHGADYESLRVSDRHNGFMLGASAAHIWTAWSQLSYVARIGTDAT